MAVRVRWSALKQSRWYEYLLRFVLNREIGYPAILEPCKTRLSFQISSKKIRSNRNGPG
jgi:hypothetical protein